MAQMTDRARKAKAAYMRAYRAKNREKEAQYQADYWDRVAAKAEAEADRAGEPVGRKEQ